MNNYEGPEEYRKACLLLCDYLREYCNLSPDTEVSIYAWYHKQSGFRIAEIGFWLANINGVGGSGNSWLRSDAESGNVICKAEDFVLYKTLDWGDEGEMFAEESLYALNYLLNKN